MTARRIPVLIFVVGALVAGAFLERSEAPEPVGPAASTVADDLARTAPVVAPTDALGSTWYCAAGTAGDVGEAPPPEEATEDEPPAEGGDEPPAEGEGEDEAVVTGPIQADQTIAIANVSGEDRTATVTVHPGTDDPIVTTVEVPADTVERVVLAELVDAPAVAALVEAAGGGIVVSHQLESEAGIDSGPCAATSSDVWHFAWGDTSRDVQSAIALFNPFPGDAVVDMTFVTADGVRDTDALTGLVIPGGSVVVADIDAEVRRRDQVSATVRTRSGRVVAERVQSFDPIEGRTGLAVDLGIPVPQEVWVHPYGRYGEGVAQRLVVFNPSDAPAEVDVEINLGDEVVGGVEPFELTVRPNGYEVVSFADAARLAEVFGEDDSEFGVTVRSLNGTPVVSDLVTVASGTAVSAGSAGVSNVQVIVDPVLGTTQGSRVRLVNLDGENPVTATVEVIRNGRRTLLAGGEVEVDPAGRLIVDLESVGTGPSAVLITSSGPLVSELVTRWGSPADLSTRPGTAALDGLVPVPVLAG